MALIDTGSQITAISEKKYKQIIAHTRVDILPVSNLSVTTAIEKKSTAVKHQIRLIIELDGRIIDSVFYVIPYLTSEIILGHDWMVKNNVIIDYSRIKIIVEGVALSPSNMVFEQGSAETLICSRKNNEMQIFIVNVAELKQIVSSEENHTIPESTAKAESDSGSSERNHDVQNKNGCKITEITDDPERGRGVPNETNRILESKRIAVENETFNIINDMKENKFTQICEINVANKSDAPVDPRAVASNLSLLGEEERHSFASLLQEFSKLFSNKPGCALGYEHDYFDNEKSLDKTHVSGSVPPPSGNISSY